MLLGFRAGDDPAIKVTGPDFAATRSAWNLPAGCATLARVFPDNPFVGAAESPAKFVVRVARAARPALAAGMVPFLSFKPDVADTVAGRMDPLLTAVAEWAVSTGVQVHMTVWHEPENDGLAAGAALGRAKNFVSTYEHAYTVIKGVAGGAVAMGPVHMSYHWRPKSETTAAGKVAGAWRTSEALRDFVGVDCYTANWSLKVGTILEAKADFQRWRSLLQVPNGKLLVVERGITRNPPVRFHPNGGQFQRAVLTADLNYLNGLGAYGFMYWNSGGATDDSNFLLGRTATARFREIAVVAAA